MMDHYPAFKSQLAGPQGGTGLTCAELIGDRARRHPDRIAIVQGPEETTYRELMASVSRLAAALVARGVSAGDVLAVVAKNSRAYVELQIASGMVGAILGCINWRTQADELSHCLDLLAPRIVFVGRDMVQTVSPQMVTAGENVGQFDILEEFHGGSIGQSMPPQPTLRVDPEAPFLIQFTSGTTGLAKGAMISQRAMIARAMISVIDRTQFEQSTFICWPPLFHMSGADNAFGTLMTGGKLIMLEKFDAAAIARTLAKEPIGLLALVPATVEPMLTELERQDQPIVSVQLVGSMADLVQRPVLAAITRRLGAPFRNTFGSTEAGPAPASAGRVPVGSQDPALPKWQSAFTLVKLVDDGGDEVPVGVPGEALVKGPTLFSGYWQNQEATAAAFTDGWYRTGDILMRNEDGSFVFVDRRKYLIKSGGENIYPAEIERILALSARIAEAIAVKMPDPRWGEVPALFVVAKDPGLTAEDVRDMLEGRIASFKIPKIVRFCGADDLPRTSTGKVQRQILERWLVDPREPGRANQREGSS